MNINPIKMINQLNPVYSKFQQRARNDLCIYFLGYLYYIHLSIIY